MPGQIWGGEGKNTENRWERTFGEKKSPQDERKRGEELKGYHLWGEFLEKRIKVGKGTGEKIVRDDFYWPN